MPSIRNMLTAQGWFQGVGPHFYYPQVHPHAHVGINGETNVNSLAEIRGHIMFISLSYGGAPPTVNLYQRNPPAEILATDAANSIYDLEKKAAFEQALHGTIGIEVAMRMQALLNDLTGMGLDL
jgi:hypothetical protein